MHGSSGAVFSVCRIRGGGDLVGPVALWKPFRLACLLGQSILVRAAVDAKAYLDLNTIHLFMVYLH